jgi:hypothetical protein
MRSQVSELEAAFQALRGDVEALFLQVGVMMIIIKP